MSLSRKIILIGVGCYALMLGLFWEHSRRSMQKSLMMHAENIATWIRREEEHIDVVCLELQRNAVDLANALREVMDGHPRMSDREWERRCEAILRDNLATYREPMGNGFYMIPEELGRSRFIYHGRTQASDLVTEANKPDGFDYSKRQWYLDIRRQISKREGKAVAWSASYRDANPPHDWVVTAACPVRGDAGKAVGVAMLDWKIDDVVKRLSSMHPTEHSFAVLSEEVHDSIVASDAPQEALAAVEEPDRDSSWWAMVLWAPVFGDPSSGIRLVKLGKTPYLAFGADLETGMRLLVFVPQAELEASPCAEARVAGGMLLMIALVILLLVDIAWHRWLIVPLRRLMDSVWRMSRGDLNVHFDEGGRDEIGQLGRAFNAMTADLQRHMEQLRKETAVRERVASDLAVAAQIQQAMLPGALPLNPPHPEFAVAASMRAAREVGGDFYDFCMLDDEHLYFAMCDVSGKGVPAALCMMSTRTILRSLATRGLAVEEILARANKSLCENNQAGMFVTALIGILEVRTGTLRLANAGHNPPVLRPPGGANSFLRLKPGLVLGGMAETRFRVQEIRLAPGEMFYCYTDGVTEAQNHAGELFGEKRLLATLPAVAEPTEALRTVDAAVAAYENGAAQADDLTHLCIVYHGR